MKQSVAFLDQEVQSLDWDKEYQPPSHPLKIKVKGKQILDLETGAVIAVIRQTHRAYWRHGHIHFAPATWAPPVELKPDDTTQSNTN